MAPGAFFGTSVDVMGKVNTRTVHQAQNTGKVGRNGTISLMKWSGIPQQWPVVPSVP